MILVRLLFDFPLLMNSQIPFAEDTIPSSLSRLLKVVALCQLVPRLTMAQGLQPQERETCATEAPLVGHPYHRQPFPHAYQRNRPVIHEHPPIYQNTSCYIRPVRRAPWDE